MLKSTMKGGDSEGNGYPGFARREEFRQMIDPRESFDHPLEESCLVTKIDLFAVASRRLMFRPEQISLEPSRRDRGNS